MSEDSKTSGPSDPAAIEADIEATRARLAGTVDELAVRVHPKTIAQRGIDDAKLRAQAAVTTPNGQLRVERVAAVAVAAVSLIVLTVWRRLRK